MNTLCKPHFHTVKLGLTGVYLFFLFLFNFLYKTYIVGTQLVHTINVLSKKFNVFSKNIKNIKIFPIEFSIFASEKKSLYTTWTSNGNEMNHALTP